MPPESQKIMVVAGEASGDMHGASLIEALKRLDPSLRFYGVGGARLREAGVEIVADAADMAVVGLTEVFLKLPFIRKVMKSLTSSWKDEKPAAIILVDYPDFNLILARKAHAQGIKVFYYVSPQIWAWRKGRIKAIRRDVDTMAVILPFEESLYREAGIDAAYVGHPILDSLPVSPSRGEARKKIGIAPNMRTVSLLPGSRPGEVERLLPLCLKAAERLQAKGKIQFIMPLASTLSREFVEGIISRHKVRVSLVANGMYDVLAASDLAVVASGTATLETALMETPMIIIYRVSRLSYLLGRMFIQVKNIGLVNIIAGRTIVPELIQANASPGRIAACAADLLENSKARKAMKKDLSRIRELLGSPGAAERAAALVTALLKTDTAPKGNQ